MRATKYYSLKEETTCKSKTRSFTLLTKRAARFMTSSSLPLVSRKFQNVFFAIALCTAALSIPAPGFSAPLDSVSASTPAESLTARVAAVPLVERQVVHLQAIPYKKVMRMSEGVPVGQMKVARAGQQGIFAKTYQVDYKDDQILRCVFIGRHLIKAPVDEMTLAGIRVREARALPSRSGTYSRVRELEMVATGYSPYEGSGAGRCANGMRAGYGVVAVDPRVIRLGSRLYISGYGYAIAGDTGGAIKRNRIDLGHTTYREAERVGRRRVKVTVLDSPH